MHGYGERSAGAPVSICGQPHISAQTRTTTCARYLVSWEMGRMDFPGCLAMHYGISCERGHRVAGAGNKPPRLHARTSLSNESE